ncbi:hypothetical protein TNIN_208861 [Trichonephila inaurata madagascariensis]|uniref:Uncharacterized protein n=1 Tax=Trichonephila inaurata madagascariensis TaxID=2747483 RepID=A0A8X6JPN4_9ARAC|nr:hypothetical protein TNIN_208861 [Trichonephila inaurata madagascariensis]
MEQQELFKVFFELFLDSKNLFLNDQGLQLASTIYSRATREAIRRNLENYNSVWNMGNFQLEYDRSLTVKTCFEDAFIEKIGPLKKDLGEIIDLFQKLNDARNEFMGQFYSWSFLRLKRIEELKQFQTSLDYALFNSDVSEIATGVFKFAAGVTVLGTLLWPFHLAIIPAVGVGVAGGGLVGGAAILLWKYLVNCGITPLQTPEKAQRFLNIERESLPKLKN